VRFLTALVAANTAMSSGAHAAGLGVALMTAVSIAAYLLGLILDRWLTLRRHTERTPR
jgi:hypothetical protein